VNLQTAEFCSEISQGNFSGVAPVKLWGFIYFLCTITFSVKLSAKG